MEDENKNTDGIEIKDGDFDQQKFMDAARGNPGGNPDGTGDSGAGAGAGDGIKDEATLAAEKLAADAAAAGSGTQVDLDPYWKGLAETYKGEDGKYELPKEILTGKKESGEDLTEAERYKMLQDHIIANNPPVIRDPFIVEYLEESQKKDFDRSKFLQTKQKESNVMNLPAKDFLKEVYKSHAQANKLEWSDDMVQSKLDKMDDIDAEFEANKFKSNMQNVQSNREYNINEQNKVRMNADLETAQAETEVLLNTYIDENKEKTNIGGFEFGESDRQEYIEFLPEFTKKEVLEVDGRPYIASKADVVLNEIFQNPKQSLNILSYLYLVHKGKIDGFNADALEAKKEDLERKLKGDRKDNIQPGAGQHDKPGFDMNAFMAAAKKK